MIPEVSGMVSYIYGMFCKERKFSKVMEGYGRYRGDPGHLRMFGRFHKRCNHVAIRDKEISPTLIRIGQRRQFWSRFGLTYTYRNSIVQTLGLGQERPKGPFHL